MAYNINCGKILNEECHDFDQLKDIPTSWRRRTKAKPQAKRPFKKKFLHNPPLYNITAMTTISRATPDDDKTLRFNSSYFFKLGDEKIPSYIYVS